MPNPLISLVKENTMSTLSDFTITANMDVDGVHVTVNDCLSMIVDNDPDDLIIRLPHLGERVHSVEEAVSIIFGATNRQEHLGMCALLSICIFQCFEDQGTFQYEC